MRALHRLGAAALMLAGAAGSAAWPAVPVRAALPTGLHESGFDQGNDSYVRGSWGVAC